MNYNGVGPWNDAVLSLKIEESRMLGSVLSALNGREVDPFLQGPNMISQPRCHRWCPLLERLPLPLTAAPDTSYPPAAQERIRPDGISDSLSVLRADEERMIG